MKKFFVFAFSAAALTLASCGGNSTESAQDADSLMVDSAAVVEDPIAALQAAIEAGDTEQIQTLLEQAAEQLNVLSEEEKAEYASKLQQFVEENKAKLEEASISTTTLDDVVSTIKNLPESAQELGENAVDAAKEDVQNAASEAVESAKASAEEKVQSAKDAANQKVEDAANKASDKVNEGISKAASKLKL